MLAPGWRRGRIALRRAWLALAIVPALAGAASSDDPARPPPEPARRSETLEAFIARHPDCTEVTDSCFVCVIADGKSHCSTAGIACIQQDPVCVRRK